MTSRGGLLLFIFIHLRVIFWQVEVKLIGPFVCNGRMKHVMVFMDVFSLWPEAAIVESMSSTVVTHVIINLICRLVQTVLQSCQIRGKTTLLDRRSGLLMVL
jgi:hypothetical protein